MLHRILDYYPPEFGHPAYLNSNPFCGRTVEQTLIEPSTRQQYIFKGKQLVNQCQHISKSTGKRCQRTTDFDYTTCWVHLVKRKHLLVAPSRIPGANYGLYAVSEDRLMRYGYDQDKRPLPDPSTIVFQPGALIGGKTTYFKGEILTQDELEERYPSPNGGDYICQGPTDDTYSDEFFARTVISYVNDGVNLADQSLGRNYYVKNGRKVRYCTDRSWPVVNARGEEIMGSGHHMIGLFATGPIRHGQEIYWTYSGYDGPSRTNRGEWLMDENEDPLDAYWAAINHAGGSRIPP